MKSVAIGTMCMQCHKLQQVFEVHSFGLDLGPRLYRRSFIADITMFEVSSVIIRCSVVSTRYCCYGNHAAGSKPV